jgi:spermidine synthase
MKTEHARLRATALLAGILTLGIEIVVGRLLAPFFGSSLFEWAALIGVVLLAYVVGYGAFHRITRHGITVPLALGGVYALSLPFWLFNTVSHLLSLPMPIASVLGALLAAGVPSLLWASILPELQRRSGSGRSASMLAWSAVGNLIGAWGVAFIAVPELGTRVSLVGIGALALVLALVWVRGSRSGAVTVGLGILLLIPNAAGVQDARHPWERLPDIFVQESAGLSKSLVELRDSGYQQIAVWDEKGHGVDHRALSLNGSLQFLWTPKDKLIGGGDRYEYYNFSTAAALWTAQGLAKKVLILGLGGGLIPWQIHQFYPDVDITSFELDPEVARVAERSLPLAQAGKVRVVVGDGRVLLHQSREKFDYILLDTFLNSYVPFHLTTKEFFETAKARLNPGGILVANFHTVFSTSGLLPKLEATISSVFPSVGAVDLPAGTTLVMASPDPAVLTERLRSSEREAPPALAELTERASSTMRAASSPEDLSDAILTDDRNDTEQRLYQTRKYILVSRPI